MKRILFIAMALAFLPVAGMMAFAEQGQEMEQSEEQLFAGLVTSVNAGANTLTLTEAGHTAEQAERQRMTFTLGPDTKIQENDREIRLGDIQTGDPVLLTYTVSEGKNVAKLIEVLTRPT